MTFQGLAIAAVAPTVADAIGGENLYGWIFSAFLLPQIIGTVIGAAYPDRLRPAILAAMSSAWIVPSLVGPALAGFV